MAGMPATGALNGLDPIASMNPMAGLSGTFGDLAGGTSSSASGDVKGSNRTGPNLVFGNLSQGNDKIIYIAAAIAALWIFKGRK